jgi:hypothetical protein
VLYKIEELHEPLKTKQKRIKRKGKKQKTIQGIYHLIERAEVGNLPPQDDIIALIAKFEFQNALYP